MNVNYFSLMKSILSYENRLNSNVSCHSKVSFYLCYLYRLSKINPAAANEIYLVVYEIKI